MESTASGGVDRTVLRLSFEGHQPDTEAMRRLYDNPEAITFGEFVTTENGDNAPNSKVESVTEAVSKGKNNGERVIFLLKSNGELTLSEVAQILNLSLDGIEKIVRQLKRNGILIREGSTKAGHWVVKDGSLQQTLIVFY